MPENEYMQRIYKGMYVTNHAIQYWVFTPLIFLAVYYALFELEMIWWHFILSFSGSLVFWTIFEYCMHRYFFHFNPKSILMRKFLYSMHWGHHEYPNDNRIMLVNPLVSLPVAFVFFLISYLVIQNYAFPFMAGVMSVYLLYDWFHYASHNKNYKNLWFQLMKQHHMKHHYQDPTRNYGFTSTVCDKILNTEIDIKNNANQQLS